MAQIICQIKLKRIGGADYQNLGIQHLTEVPAHNEIIEITVQDDLVKGRVSGIASPRATAFFEQEVFQHFPPANRGRCNTSGRSPGCLCFRGLLLSSRDGNVRGKPDSQKRCTCGIPHAHPV